MIRIQGNVYELIEENKNGFKLEAVKERYSDILNKFDYLVGDWGYGQLRLKGLFEDTNRKAPYDSRLSFLDEYLLEYCNFGCAYFVLKKSKEPGQSNVEETDVVEPEDHENESRKAEKAEGHFTQDTRDPKRRERRRQRPRRKNKETQEV
ncbi:YutD family protein [Aneurinibacillus terranovensis]|uniref:YutD family protein n=1 Tax=Aneurinibacillus terranovensis TaxID=278991 RepID=UPI000402A7C6|nr:YutD family protein [Aneurinibacillus terranovensis]